MKRELIVGIDEAGRGPIAGPVAVGVFLFLQKVSYPKNLPVRDSKKLSKIQREKWFAQIKIWKKEKSCDFSVTLISAQIIDKIGISQSIKNAMKKSLNKLVLNKKLKINSKTKILLDGSLKAPIEFKNQQTIIKGDEKIPAISFASICAKVTRDLYMEKMAKQFPKYGFELHKGYGTKLHYAKIKQYGISKLHRKSFLKNL